MFGLGRSEFWPRVGAVAPARLGAIRPVKVRSAALQRYVRRGFYALDLGFFDKAA